MKNLPKGSHLDREALAATPIAGIELHIEEIVLHGFKSSDRGLIGDAVEQELSRLLALERRFPAFENALDHVKASTFRASFDTRPAAIGAEIARSVHESISTAQHAAVSSRSPALTHARREMGRTKL
jgi:hypothetical protein